MLLVRLLSFVGVALLPGPSWAQSAPELPTQLHVRAVPTCAQSSALGARVLARSERIRFQARAERWVRFTLLRSEPGAWQARLDFSAHVGAESRVLAAASCAALVDAAGFVIAVTLDPPASELHEDRAAAGAARSPGGAAADSAAANDGVANDGAAPDSAVANGSAVAPDSAVANDGVANDGVANDASGEAAPRRSAGARSGSEARKAPPGSASVPALSSPEARYAPVGTLEDFVTPGPRGPVLPWHASFGALGQAQHGAAPVVLPALGVFWLYAQATRAGLQLSPALRLTGSVALERTFTTAYGSAEFSLLAGSVEVCPLAWGGSFWWWRVCAAGVGANLRAAGKEAEQPQSRQRPWAMVGASLLGGLELGAVQVQLGATAGPTLIRDTFQFEPRVVHTTGSWAAQWGVGVGYVWR